MSKTHSSMWQLTMNIFSLRTLNRPEWKRFSLIKRNGNRSSINRWSSPPRLNSFFTLLFPSWGNECKLVSLHFSGEEMESLPFLFSLSPFLCPISRKVAQSDLFEEREAKWLDFVTWCRRRKERGKYLFFESHSKKDSFVNLVHALSLHNSFFPFTRSCRISFPLFKKNMKCCNRYLFLFTCVPCIQF